MRPGVDAKSTFASRGVAEDPKTCPKAPPHDTTPSDQPHARLAGQANRPRRTGNEHPWWRQACSFVMSASVAEGEPEAAESRAPAPPLFGEGVVRPPLERTRSCSFAPKRKSYSTATSAAAGRPPDLRESYNGRRPSEPADSPQSASAPREARRRFDRGGPTSCLRTTGSSTRDAGRPGCCHRSTSAADRRCSATIPFDKSNHATSTTTTIALLLPLTSAALSQWRHSDRERRTVGPGQRGLGGGAAEATLHRQPSVVARRRAAIAEARRRPISLGTARRLWFATLSSGRSKRSGRRLRAQTRWCSPPALDPAVVQLESSRWIVTAQASCSMQPPRRSAALHDHQLSRRRESCGRRGRIQRLPSREGRGRPSTTAQRARLDDRQAGSAHRSARKRARQNRYCAVAQSGAARRCRCGARTLTSRPAGVPPRPLRQWRRTTYRSGARARPCCLTATVDPKHTPPRNRGQRLNREGQANIAFDAANAL